MVVGGDGGHLSVVEEALRDLGLQNHVELKGLYLVKTCVTNTSKQRCYLHLEVGKSNRSP